MYFIFSYISKKTCLIWFKPGEMSGIGEKMIELLSILSNSILYLKKENIEYFKKYNTFFFNELMDPCFIWPKAGVYSFKEYCLNGLLSIF